jgi:hypothetical protein
MEFGIQAKLVGSHVNMEGDDRGWFSGTMSKPAFHAQILLNIEHLRRFFRSSATIYGTINHQDQLFRRRRRQSCDDQTIWFQNCTAKQNSAF